MYLKYEARGIYKTVVKKRSRATTTHLARLLGLAFPCVSVVAGIRATHPSTFVQSIQFSGGWVDGCTSVQVQVQVQVQAQGTPISSHPIPHHPISWSIAAQVTPSHTHHTLSHSRTAFPGFLYHPSVRRITSLLPTELLCPFPSSRLLPPSRHSFRGHEVDLRSNYLSVCATH